MQRRRVLASKKVVDKREERQKERNQDTILPKTYSVKYRATFESIPPRDMIPMKTLFDMYPEAQKPNQLTQAKIEKLEAPLSQINELVGKTYSEEVLQKVPSVYYPTLFQIAKENGKLMEKPKVGSKLSELVSSLHGMSSEEAQNELLTLWKDNETTIKNQKLLETPAILSDIVRTIATIAKNSPDRGVAMTPFMPVIQEIIRQEGLYKFKSYGNQSGNHIQKYRELVQENVLVHTKTNILLDHLLSMPSFPADDSTKALIKTKLEKDRDILTENHFNILFKTSSLLNYNVRQLMTLLRGGFFLNNTKSLSASAMPRVEELLDKILDRLSSRGVEELRPKEWVFIINAIPKGNIPLRNKVDFTLLQTDPNKFTFEESLALFDAMKIHQLEGWEMVGKSVQDIFMNRFLLRPFLSSFITKSVGDVEKNLDFMDRVFTPNPMGQSIYPQAMTFFGIYTLNALNNLNVPPQVLSRLAIHFVPHTV